MTWAIKLLIVAAILVAGFMGGVKYHTGVVASRDLATAQAQRSDAIQQRKFNEQAAGKQAATVANISNQLGNAREKIALLSGRQCLDAGTVSVLNAVGAELGRTTPGEPSGEAPATATVAGIRFATQRDTATAIATCRAYYGEVSGQLNQILDIEDRRWPEFP